MASKPTISLDAADMTWTPVSAETWAIGVLYAEVEVRDWRWLWLRKRRTTILLGTYDPAEYGL